MVLLSGRRGGASSSSARMSAVTTHSTSSPAPIQREGHDPACGIIVLTSRVSVEMVQKAAAIGAPVIAAISAPTALAVRTADAAGITLVAVARRDTFEIFTHPQRISDRESIAAANLEHFSHAG